MKKAVALFLAFILVLALAGCGNQEIPQANPGTDQQTNENISEQPGKTEEVFSDPITLSNPIDLSIWQAESKSDYMDFNVFFSDFEWIEENYNALADYIELLCTEYDFEQSGETYFEQIWEEAFFDMVLRYTGDKVVAGDGLKGVHSDNLGDLMIFGSLDKYGRLNCNFQCDPALQGGDDGYRYGQTEQTNTPVGESLAVGLEYDGITYSTTDGRLSTTLNNACILADSQRTDYSARFEIDLNRQKLVVYAEDKYGNAIQCFYVPTLNGWRTDVYSASEFIIGGEYGVQTRGVRDRLPGDKWSNMFSAVHNGSYVYPVSLLSGEMNGLGFRVMYQDEEVIVFYTCATFRSQPNTVEALIAVSTDVEPVSEDNQDSDNGDSSEKCGSCFGSGNCSHCGGSGKENNWIAGTNEYVTQNCRYCLGSRKCQTCFGSGKK